MKTDYTGCNKEIAESLKRGEHIKCTVCSDKREEVIVAYCIDKDSSAAYVDSNGNHWVNAYVPKTETYVIDAVSMMKGLIERGYVVDKHGWWFTKASVLRSNAWSYCGKLSGATLTWEDWMLEEVK